MRRGTTPRLTFTIDNFDYSLVKQAQMTIKQNYKTVMIRFLEIGDDCMYIDLSQNDTLALKPEPCQIQVKLQFNDGKVVASNIGLCGVKDILNEEIMQ